MNKEIDPSALMSLTTEIVVAYVGNNTVFASELPTVINAVSEALCAVSAKPWHSSAVELIPAVSIKNSVSPEYIICLEDGKSFKSLKRHLRTSYGMTPEEYREKWGLPHDYPMVAPNYAAIRSTLAKKMGLGRKRG